MKPGEMPGPDDIKKFEIREQQGINKASSEAATGWINLTQLLEKVLKILDHRDLAEIVALAQTDEDARIGEAALKENERWKHIFELGKSHLEEQLKVMNAHKDLTKQYMSTIHVLNQLPSDELLLKRLDRLSACLNELERHHKSGLLQAVAKL